MNAPEDALTAAIATIQDSRRTHVEWRDHWLRMRSEGHEDCEGCKAQAAVTGGLEHQEACIAAYDNVLAVLGNVAEREAQAWDEGRDHGDECASLAVRCIDNPYRRDQEADRG